MKKTIAVIAELIPVISALLAYLLIFAPIDTLVVRGLTSLTTLLAFLGFAFFFVGRNLAKEDKTVKILGIFDILATLSIIVLYTLAIFSFAL